jgi:IS1 family transposase
MAQKSRGTLRRSHGLSTSESKSLAGSKYVLVAQEAKTKLVTSHHVGGRALEDAVELLTDMETRRDKSTELPIFTSDDWDAYKSLSIERGGEVADVKKRVVFGDKEEVLKLGGNSINTSYIERNNLTVRNGVSRLIRKTINFSKCLNHPHSR